MIGTKMEIFPKFNFLSSCDGTCSVFNTPGECPSWAARSPFASDCPHSKPNYWHCLTEFYVQLCDVVPTLLLAGWWWPSSDGNNFTLLPVMWSSHRSVAFKWEAELGQVRFEGRWNCVGLDGGLLLTKTTIIASMYYVWDPTKNPYINSTMLDYGGGRHTVVLIQVKKGNSIYKSQI